MTASIRVLQQLQKQVQINAATIIVTPRLPPTSSSAQAPSQDYPDYDVGYPIDDPPEFVEQDHTSK